MKFLKMVIILKNKYRTVLRPNWKPVSDTKLKLVHFLHCKIYLLLFSFYAAKINSFFFFSLFFFLAILFIYITISMYRKLWCNLNLYQCQREWFREKGRKSVIFFLPNVIRPNSSQGARVGRQTVEYMLFFFFYI